MTEKQLTRSSEFWAGVRATVPMIVGAAPFGLIFGALAVTNGLSPLAVLAMSLFVYAGSAQFVGANLVASGAALPVIWLTTFVINMRHMLYSATLAPHMKHLGQKWLLPLGFWLTDETFAVVIARYNAPDASPYKQWYHLGSSVSMYGNWFLCTLIGVVAGQAVPDATGWGLDFAMVVTFIGIVVPLVKNRPTLASVIVSGIVAVIANPLPNKLGLMVAAAAGILTGVVLEMWGARGSGFEQAAGRTSEDTV